MGPKAQKEDLQEERAANCAYTSEIIDVVEEIPLFEKTKADTREEQLRILGFKIMTLSFLYKIFQPVIVQN